jgi:hypothetical protein
LLPVSCIVALSGLIVISSIVLTMQKYNLQEQCKNTNYREQYKVLITGENTRIQHTWNNPESGIFPLFPVTGIELYYPM